MLSTFHAKIGNETFDSGETIRLGEGLGQASFALDRDTPALNKTNKQTQTTHSATYAGINPTQPSLSPTEGKVVLITGASGGIGRATASSFAASDTLSPYPPRLTRRCSSGANRYDRPR